MPSHEPNDVGTRFPAGVLQEHLFSPWDPFPQPGCCLPHAILTICANLISHKAAEGFPRVMDLTGKTAEQRDELTMETPNVPRDSSFSHE